MNPIWTRLITATEFEVHTDPHLLKLLTSASMLSRLGFYVTNVNAVVELLIQYSETFDSSYEVTFQEAFVSDILRDLVSCGFMQGAVESTYFRHVGVIKLMRRFLENL